MPTAYTSLLGLALPVTGELSGTWGDTVNDYITKYLDSSVAGTQTISGSQTAVTLTRANGGALSPVGSGSTGSSQYQIINCTGNPAGTLTITVDVSTGTYALSNSTYSQTFAVINATSTSQSVVVRATTTTGTSTGVTLVAGEKAVIAWNGSDFIKVATSAVDGVSTISFGTTGLTPSTATSGAVTVAGTLATTNGGTGLTSFTANGVVYASSSSALTTGSALTFDGTNLALGMSALAARVMTVRGRAAFVAPSTDSQLALYSDGTTNGIYSTYNSSGSYLPMTFYTADVERMRLTSGGDLGIGTSSPGYKLTVAGGATSLAANQYLRFGAAPFAAGDGSLTNYLFSGSTSLTWRNAADNADLMYLSNSGNLGIGTSSPAYKLHISGSGAQAAQITSTSGSASVILQNFTGAGNYAYIQYNGHSGSGLQFYDTANVAARMTLDSSGNLLIGYTSNNLQSGTFGQTIYGSIPGLTFAGTEANARIYTLYETGGSFKLFDRNAGADRWTVDSSGNLGLGVTPPTGSNQAGIFLSGTNNVFGGAGNGASFTSNVYNSSGTWKYATSSFATLYQQTSGQHVFYTAASGTATNNISWTQAMTLDASGNLGVGTTSPNFFGSGTTGITVNGSSGSHLEMLSNGASLGFLLANSNGLQLQTNSNNPLVFNTNNTERLRIASNGAWGLAGANYGTSGQVLTSNGSGSAPTWQTVGGGGGSPGGSSGQVQFNNSGAFGGSANLFWDNTNARLGIRTSSPTCALEVDAPAAATGTVLAITNSAQWGWDTYLDFRKPLTNGGAVGLAGRIVSLYESSNNYGFTFNTTSGGTNTERMRIDAAGRVGINTTLATANLARLQVNHDAALDRYGVYVPGGIYTSSGPSGDVYGGFFRNNTSNSTTGNAIAVYGRATGPAQAAQYGGYFDGDSAASNPCIGVFGKANQNDVNGPGVATGVYALATTVGGSGGTGSTYGVRAENQGNKGDTAAGVFATTVAGATNIFGYIYNHAGALQFRVKSNGGIDNYQSNDSNLSDRREKKDFAPAKNYLDTICAIPVQTFKYINQTDDEPTLGVIAQDVQAVAPELVAETDWSAVEDDEPKMRLSVYQTDLQYALMKCIQELKTELDTVKAELATLKGA